VSSLTNKQADTHTGTIRFLLDGVLHEVKNIEPATTVLNYLREKLQRTGAKEGCAEGDCGACTVVVAETDGKRVLYRPINACIQFLPVLDGKVLFTVESLKKINGNNLHPTQQAMVDCHGSQCGFCTPGFVMSLFALFKNNDNPSREDIDDALAGNLCRCTGYRPIIAAAQSMYHYGKDQVDEKNLLTQLEKIKPQTCLQLTGEGKYFAPLTTDELAELLQQYPDATILAGGTDVGLWVTKRYRELPVMIYIGNVAELNSIEESDDYTEIGAAVTLTDAFAVLEKYHPDLREIMRRFASPPIRNAGTLCGNIANGSPIGDAMPALSSLDASLILRSGDDLRELPLDEFYLGYQKKAFRKSEFVQSVRIPLPGAGDHFRAYKLSKRFDQDISAVCVAFNAQIEGGVVTDIRITYGGMAAMPKRAAHCENVIKGRQWNEATVQAAIDALTKDFQPVSDMRASKGYRLRAAGNLLKRYYLETSGDVVTRIEQLQPAG